MGRRQPGRKTRKKRRESMEPGHMMDDAMDAAKLARSMEVSTVCCANVTSFASDSIVTSLVGFLYGPRTSTTQKKTTGRVAQGTPRLPSLPPDVDVLGMPSGTSSSEEYSFSDSSTTAGEVASEDENENVMDPPAMEHVFTTTFEQKLLYFGNFANYFGVSQKMLTFLDDLCTIVSGGCHSSGSGIENPVRPNTSDFEQYRLDIEYHDQFRQFKIIVVLTMSVDSVRLKRVMRLKAELAALERDGILVRDSSNKHWHCSPVIKNAVVDFSALKISYDSPRWQSDQGCHLCLFSTNALAGGDVEMFFLNNQVKELKVDRRIVTAVCRALESTRTYTYASRIVLGVDDFAQMTGSEKDEVKTHVRPLSFGRSGGQLRRPLRVGMYLGLLASCSDADRRFVIKKELEFLLQEEVSTRPVPQMVRLRDKILNIENERSRFPVEVQLVDGCAVPANSTIEYSSLRPEHQNALNSFNNSEFAFCTRMICHDRIYSSQYWSRGSHTRQDCVYLCADDDASPIFGIVSVLAYNMRSHESFVLVDQLLTCDPFATLATALRSSTCAAADRDMNTLSLVRNANQYFLNFTGSTAKVCRAYHIVSPAMIISMNETSYVSCC
ncbi:hypothetical protein ANCCAN_11716 [Ancylostoma caninum]|uniref:Uncharacterized protein n=1 Tax=Ancylostoma caninum TaxID=29170 RepID=A0A368GD31_ANCCA|nr:hypothetical protein ANCCAN_11716 [Ancylostoma caninum]